MFPRFGGQQVNFFTGPIDTIYGFPGDQAMNISMTAP